MRQISKSSLPYLGQQRGWLRARPADQIRALAVLPFDNLTGDTAQQYTADAITDALTTRLAQIEQMGVISRSSAMRYKAVGKKLPEIGRDSKVDAVVHGAVVRSGPRLRITTQLVHPETERHLWARSYEGELGEVIALEQRIAEELATALGRRLPAAARSRRPQTVPRRPGRRNRASSPVVLACKARGTWRNMCVAHPDRDSVTHGSVR